MTTSPKYKSAPMEIDTPSPTRDNTPAFKAMFRSSKSGKQFSKWTRDDITPVSQNGENIILLNPNFPVCKREILITSVLPQYSEIRKTYPSIMLPIKTRSAPKPTLVLDMDGTLTHSTCEVLPNYDLRLEPGQGDDVREVFVKFRPYVKEFLAEISKHYEVVLFTAAETTYANHIMESVDPGRVHAKYRLFRETCLDTSYAYIKDLTVLGRDLSQTLIIENTLHAFAYQIDNGILVKTFEGEEDDETLPHLLKLLMKIKDEPDLRVALKDIKV